MSVRWGVLGPGRISHAFLRGVAQSDRTTAVAVASRSLERARAAAAEFGLPRAYGSYAALLDDADVDAVYIGLPNGRHAEWTIAAAKAGKHVLCEKPLGADPAEVASMIEAAEQHGVLLAEAFMYRFHPRTRRLAELLADGAIGAPRLVRSAFGFRLDDPADIRFSAELAGGALQDVGCYAVSLARLVFGAAPSEVSAVARWTPSGVDETLVGTLDYTGGGLAQVAASMAIAYHMNAQIVGTEGVIEVPDPFLPARGEPAVLRLIPDGAEPTVIESPNPDQYMAEAERFAAVVEAGPEACAAGVPEMPLAESADNAATIDALLRSAREGEPAPPRAWP
jgi:D-xylose 1-dehydrogenase (NADP+, D-xylono-1,5-lactone-forming)